MRRAIFDAKTRLTMRADRKAFAEMIAAERLPVAQRDVLVSRRSAAIALHAFRTTEFYREHYQAAGLSEADIAQPGNFVHLPALTKEHLQDAGDSLIARGLPARERLPSRTGGSTGRPLLAYNDRSAPIAAMWWRIYSWWGVHPADNAAFIYRQARSGRKKLVYDLEWWPTQHVLLDARGATADSVTDFDRRVRRVRPRLLVGYVEGVADYAVHVRDSGDPPPRLAAISVTASMLHAGQRELIEAALGAPVFDSYRSAEVPWIAAECAAHEGLHVPDDRRRVDIVDDEGKAVAEGEVGEVLVTDFDNRVFPLVRYTIGDRTRRLGGACGCGRTLSRIAPIQGRIADVLRTPTGRTVSGGLGGLFNGWPGVVRQFQVHQAADFSVSVRYVPGTDARAAEGAAESVAAAVSGFLAGEVPVRAVAVPAVESVGGKARLVISEAVKAAE